MRARWLHAPPAQCLVLRVSCENVASTARSLCQQLTGRCRPATPPKPFTPPVHHAHSHHLSTHPTNHHQPHPLRTPAATPGAAAEVLDLMGSMLGFTPEDKAKIAESRRRQGWRDISLASDVTLQGGAPLAGGKQSLTDSWIDFLQKQIEADAAADAAAGKAGGGAGSGGSNAPAAPAAGGMQPVAL